MNDRYIAEILDKVGRGICLAIEKAATAGGSARSRQADALDSIATALLRISNSLETIAARSASDDRRWPQ